MPAPIEARGLHKSYGELPVLDGIDLTVPAGTVFGLLGPNGAGKTTLVRILATLLPFDAGTVRIGGHDVARDPAAVRGTIGLTGQYAAVDELLTGEENLLLLGRLLHLDRASVRRRATELLERFDLVAAGGRRVATYSGGMRRRLDLAASLLAAPPVLFLDEPTTGLDPASRRRLWETVRTLAEDQGVTILLTTQYLEEADELADRVAVLHGGRIVTEGRARELKAQVGRERLTVRFDGSGAASRASALFEDAGGVLTVGTDAISVPLADTAQLRHTLNRLADADLEVAAVELSAPTLDDVYFAVTGAEATTAVASAAGASTELLEAAR